MCLICFRINPVTLPGFNFELFNLNAAPAINNYIARILDTLS